MLLQPSKPTLLESLRSKIISGLASEPTEAASSPPHIPFADFKSTIYKRYDHAAHLQLIDKALADVVRYIETDGIEGTGYLIISMPPRHGKTQAVSKLFPAWFLAEHPDMRVILASYGMTLAQKNSRFARNVIASRQFTELYPNVSLATDSKAVDAWDIANHHGGMDAVGVGAGVTGKGANLIIIDDPVKSREEAESETYRNKVWDWYTDDLYTRKEPGAAIIVIMTRWHEDDLVGRLLNADGDRWHVLDLPALAIKNDPLGRKPNEALWPQRFSQATLLDIKRVLGEYSFSALYQQKPVPAEGGIFKRAWFKRIDIMPEIVKTVRFWDLAMSSKESADYTVGVKLGQGKDGHVYIMDVTRFQLEWGDVVPKITSVAMGTPDRQGDGKEVIIGVEKAGFMSRAIQELNRDYRLHDYAIFGYPVDKDKVTRALPFAARLQAGEVSVLNSHWTDSYLDEMCSFPNGTNDDQVDATSGAWAMLGKSGFEFINRDPSDDFWDDDT